MRVSIIVPCRNEAKFIDDFLTSAFTQQLPDPGDELEIVVADGHSDDGTQARLAEWQTRQALLVVIDNPKRITSAALNLAIAQATGDYVVRMDVHTVYAPDYAAACVAALRRTNAVCAGGAWKPVGRGWPQAAIAAAFQSRFGSGGAASRACDYEGPVDTVYLGAWRRHDLLRLGGFDESLIRNQDDELNLRITRSGGTVWQSAEVRSEYAPRGSFKALFRQFYQYGYWKVAVIRKHRLPASWRHLVPFLFVLALTSLAIGALFWPPAGWAFLGLATLYAVAAMASAATGAVRTPLGMGGYIWACLCMHTGYGIGFAQGIFDMGLTRRGPRDAMSRLTR